MARARPWSRPGLAALRGYLERTVRSPDPVYRSQAEAAMQENCQHLRAPAQQHQRPSNAARAAARLAAYERDARELAAQR